MIQAAAAETLWTIGHSTREWDVFVGMLREVEGVPECCGGITAFGNRRQIEDGEEHGGKSL